MTKVDQDDLRVMMATVNVPTLERIISRFSEEDIEKMKNIGAVAALVEKLQSAAR